MNIIETQHLTKSYKNFTAVSDLNLHIRKGTVYGFLGRNGTGKSTTMKMFLGLTKPTHGTFSIQGKQYPKERISILKDIGSFIEYPAFYGNLTGEENLETLPAYSGTAKKRCAGSSGTGRTGTLWKTSGKTIFPWYEAAPWTCRCPHCPPSYPDSG